MLAFILVGSGCTTMRWPGQSYQPGHTVPHPGRAELSWGLIRMPQLRVPRMPTFVQRWTRGDGGWWQGDGVQGRPAIHIRLGEQMAYFYKGGQLVGASPICSGSPQFPTPKGGFRVIEKDADHLSSIYGDYIDEFGNIIKTQIDRRKDARPLGTHFDGAKMYWFMRIVNGVGMHAGYLPGYADSHGCIRLPERMARIFYQNAPLGTPVRVTD